jgi:hypothetical protein
VLHGLDELWERRGSSGGADDDLLVGHLDEVCSLSCDIGKVNSFFLLGLVSINMENTVNVDFDPICNGGASVKFVISFGFPSLILARPANDQCQVRHAIHSAFPRLQTGSILRPSGTSMSPCPSTQ